MCGLHPTQLLMLRLAELHSCHLVPKLVGHAQVLVEGPSRRSAAQLTGRTDANERVIFPDVPVPTADTTAQLFADMANWAAQARPSPFTINACVCRQEDINRYTRVMTQDLIVAE